MNVGSVVVYLNFLASHELVWSLHELLQILKVLNIIVAYASSLTVVVVVLVLNTNFLYFNKLLNLV